MRDIEALRKADVEGESGPLDFLVPLEILVPADVEYKNVVSEFQVSLLEICAARNNNVELRLETKANQKGYYEELRKYLPKSISARVEWKTNDGGDIPVRDKKVSVLEVKGWNYFLKSGLETSNLSSVAAKK